VTPKTQEEALQLLVACAHRLLARLDALGLASTTPGAAEARQHLVDHLLAQQLPELLLQRKHQLAAAAAAEEERAAQQQQQQQPTAVSEYSQLAVVAAQDLDDLEMMGDLDLDQAAADAALMVPDLLQGTGAGPQQQQGGLQWLKGLEGDWDLGDSDSGSSSGWVMEGPGMTASSNHSSSESGDIEAGLLGASYELFGGPEPAAVPDGLLPAASLDLQDWEMGSDDLGTLDMRDQQGSSSSSAGDKVSLGDASDTLDTLPARDQDSTVPTAAAAAAAATADEAPAPVEDTNAPWEEYLQQLSLEERCKLLAGDSGMAGDSSAGDAAAAAAETLPGELQEAVQLMLDLLHQLVAQGPAGHPCDTAAAAMLHQMDTLWAAVQGQAGSKRQAPLFVFRDGPVTAAAKAGGLLLLEDWDSPSQAVTERLNSLLEPERSFLVAEDIIVGPAGADVVLPHSFQVGKGVELV
jgi:hypothetical protein